jgi:small subunit ribosomal protein S12
LRKCPQRRGTCVRLFTLTPRKPCSARRRVAHVLLFNRYYVRCFIPGKRSHKASSDSRGLKKYSNVLIRGGGPNDLPGVNYRIIPGVLDDTELPLISHRRSKYGIPNLYRYRRKRMRLKLLVGLAKKRGRGIWPSEVARKYNKRTSMLRPRPKFKKD